MVQKGKFKQAFAYLRTSSAANTGEDKDSDKRQASAISAYAKRVGIILVDTYYDAAVKGGDPIDQRPGFAAMLKRIEANGVRTIIVETASRFARDLIVQETGYTMLKARGIEVISADSPSMFLDDTPTAKLIRQILGAVSEFDKAMTVAKLKGARDRKRAKLAEEIKLVGGKRKAKVEGRKSVGEMRPEVVELAHRLARRTPKGGKRSLREIAAELQGQGHVTSKGQPYSATSVSRMLKG